LRILLLLALVAFAVGCNSAPQGSDGTQMTPQQLAQKRKEMAPKDDIAGPGGHAAYEGGQPGQKGSK